MKFTFAIAAGLLLGILGTNIFPVRSLEAKNPTSNANSTELHLGVGGLTENRIDACWVLEKKDGQKNLKLRNRS